MKIIISFILTIITLNCFSYFWQWLHEKKFNVYGWFELYVPLSNFRYRMDYAMQISWWGLITYCFLFIWAAWYVSLVEIKEDNGE